MGVKLKNNAVVSIGDKYVIIYHKHCTDGLVSGILAHNYAVAKGAIEIECYATNYNEGIPDIEFTGKKVIIVDFAYNIEDLNTICDKAASVMQFDHHETAVECYPADLQELYHSGRIAVVELSERLEAYFSKNHSGASLIEDVLKLNQDGQKYDVVKYVADRDLWKFEYGEKSKIVHLGLGVSRDNGSLELPGFTHNPSHIRLMDSEYYEELGAPLRDKELALCEEVSKQATLYSFLGYTMAVFNCPGSLSSEASDFTMNNTDADIVLTWFTLSNTGREGAPVKVSVRSSDNAKGVAKTIATQYFNGGGHPNASGGKADLQDIIKFLQLILVNTLMEDAIQMVRKEK